MGWVSILGRSQRLPDRAGQGVWNTTNAIRHAALRKEERRS
jgi:hypothetical protein